MPVHPCMQACIVTAQTCPKASSSSGYGVEGLPPDQAADLEKSQSPFSSAMYSSDCSFRRRRADPVERNIAFG